MNFHGTEEKTKHFCCSDVVDLIKRDIKKWHKFHLKCTSPIYFSFWSMRVTVFCWWCGQNYEITPFGKNLNWADVFLCVLILDGISYLEASFCLSWMKKKINMFCSSVLHECRNVFDDDGKTPFHPKKTIEQFFHWIHVSRRFLFSSSTFDLLSQAEFNFLCIVTKIDVISITPFLILHGSGSISICIGIHVNFVPEWLMANS